jgi:predicted nucleic acid-binding protein
MTSLILADTGPLVALLNPRDHYHKWALLRFDEFTTPLSTCEAVLTETLFLLSSCPGACDSLMELWQRETFHLDFLAEGEKPVLRKLMAKYRDLPMSFADACLVRMSELHASACIWTLDTHFGIYRRHGRQSIPLLTI